MTIGIRTGKILNLYSDTTVAGAEVKKHCATLGLKMSLNRIGKSPNFIKAGNTKILITGSMNKKTIDRLSPDILILTGSRPGMEYVNDQGRQSEMTVIAAEGFPQVSLSLRQRTAASHQVYMVRKSGAFIRRI